MAVKKKATRKSTAAKRKPGNNKSVRRAGAKKSSAKRADSSAKPIPNFRDKVTKTQMTKMIAGATDLSNKQVSSVLECLKEVIEKSIKNGGPGQFVMPGIMKINVKKVKARPARKGRNPFTGEDMMFKAKPAHKKVKISALKALKEAVS